jgi:hypothetical protein
MQAFRNNPIRYLFFAMLLLYATTADFMATTAGMVAGRDCDHPTLRVEHKCVTESAGVKQCHQQVLSTAAISHHMSAIAVVVTPAATAPQLDDSIAPFASSAELSSAPPSSAPLRC